MYSKSRTHCTGLPLTTSTQDGGRCAKISGIYLEIHIININYYIILGLFTWYQYSTVKTDS